MKYKNIDELDARIERIIKRTVQNYYTDWKNYDRPKYMGLKGSRDRKDKKMILIVRKCGTYLLTLDEIAARESAAAIYEYYYTQEATSSNYYLIDLDRLTIDRIDPETYGKEIKKAA
jgi:hypothetical protein